MNRSDKLTLPYIIGYSFLLAIVLSENMQLFISETLIEFIKYIGPINFYIGIFGIMLLSMMDKIVYGLSLVIKPLIMISVIIYDKVKLWKMKKFLKKLKN